MPVSVILTIEDAKGKQATTEFHLADGLSIAQLGAAAQALAQLVEPMIRGRIVAISVGFKVALPVFGAGDGNALQDYADVEEGARFQFRTDNGFPTAQRIPCFDEALIVVGTDQVDTSDSAVSAYINAMLDQLSVGSGGSAFTVILQDARGEAISTLASARESFQASRRNRR